MDYSRSTEVAVGADQLFAYVGNVEKLPQFVPGIVHAQRLDGGRVKVVTESGTDEAWVKVHPDEHRVEWGCDAADGYRGELVVRPTSRGATVEVRVHTDRADSEDVNAELGRILAHIKSTLESHN